jgi:hypothetical protein
VFLAVGLLLGMLAYAGGRHELLYPAALSFLLPVLALTVVVTRRPRLAVSRSFAPALVEEGDLSTVTIEVTNLSPRRTPAVRWSDALPWWPGATDAGELASLAPHGPRFAASNRRRLQYLLAPPRRGVFAIGPFTIEHSDPFGLVIATVALGEREQLVVVPEVSELPESGAALTAGDGQAHANQRRSMASDDDLMTREYRIGDALRRVHWRATARHGDLMVRQEDYNTHQEARLIFDTRRTGYRDVSTDPRDGSAPIGGTAGPDGTHLLAGAARLSGSARLSGAARPSGSVRLSGAARPSGSALFAGAALGAGTAESESFDWAVRLIASLGIHLHRAGFSVQVVETGPAQVDPLDDAARRSGHDGEFLVSLAGIRLTSPHADAAPGGIHFADLGAASGRGPVFAVVASPDAHTIDWIARQRRPNEPAVAFVLADTSGASIDFLEIEFGVPVPATAVGDRLRESGWVVVPLRLSENAVTAWSRALDAGLGARAAR